MDFLGIHLYFLFYFSFLISFCLFNRLSLVCIIKIVSNTQVNTTDKPDLRTQIRLYLLDFFCSGIQFNLLLSPYPCFISLLYLDSYVLGDDALIS